MQPNNKSDNKPVCKFFMNNNCKFGSNCKLSHGKKSKPEDAPSPLQTSKNYHKEIAQRAAFNYLEELANSAKLNCISCGKRTFLVYLECGCHDICEVCAKEQKKCSGGHSYKSWIL